MKHLPGRLVMPAAILAIVCCTLHAQIPRGKSGSQKQPPQGPKEPAPLNHIEDQDGEVPDWVTYLSHVLSTDLHQDLERDRQVDELCRFLLGPPTGTVKYLQEMGQSDPASDGSGRNAVRLAVRVGYGPEKRDVEAVVRKLGRDDRKGRLRQLTRAAHYLWGVEDLYEKEMPRTAEASLITALTDLYTPSVPECGLLDELDRKLATLDGALQDCNRGGFGDHYKSGDLELKVLAELLIPWLEDVQKRRQGSLPGGMTWAAPPGPPAPLLWVAADAEMRLDQAFDRWASNPESEDAAKAFQDTWSRIEGDMKKRGVELSLLKHCRSVQNAWEQDKIFREHWGSGTAAVHGSLPEYPCSRKPSVVERYLGLVATNELDGRSLDEVRALAPNWGYALRDALYFHYLIRRLDDADSESQGLNCRTAKDIARDPRRPEGYARLANTYQERLKRKAHELIASDEPVDAAKADDAIQECIACLEDAAGEWCKTELEEAISRRPDRHIIHALLGGGAKTTIQDPDRYWNRAALRRLQLNQADEQDRERTRLLADDPKQELAPYARALWISKLGRDGALRDFGDCMKEGWYDNIPEREAFQPLGLEPPEEGPWEIAKTLIQASIERSGDLESHGLWKGTQLSPTATQIQDLLALPAWPKDADADNLRQRYADECISQMCDAARKTKSPDWLYDALNELCDALDRLSGSTDSTSPISQRPCPSGGKREWPLNDYGTLDSDRVALLAKQYVFNVPELELAWIAARMPERQGDSGAENLARLHQSAWETVWELQPWLSARRHLLAVYQRGDFEDCLGYLKGCGPERPPSDELDVLAAMCVLSPARGQLNRTCSAMWEHIKQETRQTWESESPSWLEPDAVAASPAGEYRRQIVRAVRMLAKLENAPRAIENQALADLVEGLAGSPDPEQEAGQGSMPLTQTELDLGRLLRASLLFRSRRPLRASDDVIFAYSGLWPEAAKRYPALGRLYAEATYEGGDWKAAEEVYRWLRDEGPEGDDREAVEDYRRWLEAWVRSHAGGQMNGPTFHEAVVDGLRDGNSPRKPAPGDHDGMNRDVAEYLLLREEGGNGAARRAADALNTLVMKRKPGEGQYSGPPNDFDNVAKLGDLEQSLWRTVWYWPRLSPQEIADSDWPAPLIEWMGKKNDNRGEFEAMARQWCEEECPDRRARQAQVYLVGYLLFNNREDLHKAIESYAWGCPEYSLALILDGNATD